MGPVDLESNVIHANILLSVSFSSLSPSHSTCCRSTRDNPANQTYLHILYNNLMPIYYIRKYVQSFLSQLTQIVVSCVHIYFLQLAYFLSSSFSGNRESYCKEGRKEKKQSFKKSFVLLYKVCLPLPDLTSNSNILTRNMFSTLKDNTAYCCYLLQHNQEVE